MGHLIARTARDFSRRARALEKRDLRSYVAARRQARRFIALYYSDPVLTLPRGRTAIIL